MSGGTVWGRKTRIMHWEGEIQDLLIQIFCAVWDGRGKTPKPSQGLRAVLTHISASQGAATTTVSVELSLPYFIFHPDPTRSVNEIWRLREGRRREGRRGERERESNFKESWDMAHSIRTCFTLCCQWKLTDSTRTKLWPNVIQTERKYLGRERKHF